MKPGDFLLCYVIGISRWIGLLKVTSRAYRDSSPIWKSEVFPCRLKVELNITLALETAVPMSEVTRDFVSPPEKWGILIRSSPTRIPTSHAVVIQKALEAARANPIVRPVDPRKLAIMPKTYITKIGAVTIPVEEKVTEDKIPPGLPSETVSHEELQWLLLKLGNDMGLGVWVARNDRNRQFKGQVLGDFPKSLKKLPQQFDDATNRTIENIDVLWVQKNSIVAAFKVEHTTAIYSGLLRMADLISMQPNIDIQLFIVAPDEKREKVVEEINRPTFSQLKKPLNTVCRFIPYSALTTKLAQVGELARHLKPEFLMDISESCEIPL